MSDEVSSWTYLTPKATDRIAALRETVVDALPDRFEAETDPHVSILPGFTAPKAAYPDLADQLADTATDAPDTVTVTGVTCYNPLESDDPTFVVKLDVAESLDDIRTAHTDAVKAAGGSLKYDPVPTHITLAKSGDGDEDNDPLTDAEQDRLEAAIDGLDAEFEVPVTFGQASF